MALGWGRKDTEVGWDVGLCSDFLGGISAHITLLTSVLLYEELTEPQGPGKGGEGRGGRSHSQPEWTVWTGM